MAVRVMLQLCVMSPDCQQNVLVVRCLQLGHISHPSCHTAIVLQCLQPVSGESLVSLVAEDSGKCLPSLLHGGGQ